MCALVRCFLSELVWYLRLRAEELPGAGHRTPLARIVAALEVLLALRDGQAALVSNLEAGGDERVE